MEIDWYTGPREQLRALFELAAEDWTTDPIVINGIPLLDRVWLDLDLSGES